MPDRFVVSAFVALVESGKYIEALQRFYHLDAVVWENQQQSRTGLDALIENEQRVLNTFTTVTGRAVTVLVDGDQVCINWRFDFFRDTLHLTLDELAVQQWIDGRIVRERFYYDPAQLRPDAGQAMGEGNEPRVSSARA
ncbi:nuclear transport factor 2 family protein [Dyella flagellata]|uniref:Polyketide cyclase n=1 Tax=Dyella flagellata TaxID=1867833 RepID=A0ABQ5XDL4_9GAMM|nr:nuclear transport factor 2 family protein [Dyella flagellata]GLQ89587.1 polyketide cyclase [Dyella flagellata]